LTNLLVGERVIKEAGTNQQSVIGIVNTIWTTGFPLAVPGLAVWGEITNTKGPVTLRFEMEAPDGTNLFKLDAATQVEDPMEIKAFDFRVVNLPLPMPGEYRLSVFHNSDLLGQRRIMAALAQQPPAQMSA